MNGHSKFSSANNGSVLVALVSEGMIPLVRQPEKRSPIYWKLPGGKIEDGETAEQAAVREILEELGIDISSLDLGKPYEFPQNGHTGPYVQYLFLVAVPREMIAGHIGRVVERIDNESERLESTCFQLSELDRMVDLLPKHRDFIASLGKKAA